VRLFRSRRWLWLVASAAAGVLALLLAGVIISRQPAFQRAVAQRLAAAFGSGVTFESVGFSLIPHPSVQIRGIALPPLPNDPDEAGGSAEALVVGLRMGQLLKGDLEVRSVQLEGPRIHVERSADGRIIISELLLKILEAKGDSGDSAGSATLPMLRVQGGRLDWIDRGVAGEPIELHLHPLHGYLDADGRYEISARGKAGGKGTAKGSLVSSQGSHRLTLEVEFERLAARLALPYLLGGQAVRDVSGVVSVRTKLSGTLGKTLSGTVGVEIPTGSFGWLNLTMHGPASIGAKLDVTGSSVAISESQLSADTVDVSIPGLKAPLRAEQLTAEFDYRGDRVDFRSLQFQTYGGAVSGRGGVSLAGDLLFDANLKVEHLDLHALVAALADPDTHLDLEQLEGELQLTGPWPRNDAARRALKGSGHIRLSGGTMTSMSVMKAVWHGFVEKVPGLAAIHDPDKREKPPRIDHAAQSFRIGRGRIVTDDLSVVTSAFSLTGAGYLDFAGTLDYQTQVVFTSEGIQEMVSLSALHLPSSEQPKLEPVPLHISGSVREPDVRADLSHVSLAGLSLLLLSCEGVAHLPRHLLDGLRSAAEAHPDKLHWW